MNTPNLPRRFLQVPHIEIVHEIYRSTCHAPKFCLVVPSTVTINYRSIAIAQPTDIRVMGIGRIQFRHARIRGVDIVTRQLFDERR